MHDEILILLEDARGRDTIAAMPIDGASLVDLARSALIGEGFSQASISIVVVDNATIQDLNRRRLDHDWPTDVITFPLSEPDDAILEAEIVISAEMAYETAKEFEFSPHAELSLYLVHGLLHLCEYDDRTESDAQEMRKREGEVLEHVGISNTFARVAPAGQGGVSWKV